MTVQVKLDDSHRRRQLCRDRPGRLRRSPGEKRTHEVLAQFSHELRNSLGTIRNAMHVFGVGTAENVAQEKSRVLVLRQVEKMARLVDDMLDVSRMRNGRLQLRRARIDLCIVVAHALHAVECAMQQREQRMTASLPDMPVWMLGDDTRLEQVFVNLLMNATKYTPVGGDVSLSVTREGTEAVVVIRDAGIGIAAAVLPTVFDPYVQANPSSRDGGLGLGLPLVRSLVQSHGGSVTAASDGIGHGSEFTVRLPAFAGP